jgi:glyoxylase-like metal-dependent hydrolase (beta-lactamase superfamily II)
MQIADNLHLIPGLGVNQYLIVDADGLTLIDAGMDRRAAKILDAIARLGYSPADLQRIVITHADGDHAGGLAALKAASGARVLASPVEAAALEAGRASRELKVPAPIRWLLALAPWFKIVPVPIEERVGDGQVLPALGGLRVVETPGHTPGHISLYAPAAGILFAGDSLISRNGRLHLPRAALNWDQRRAMESAQAQAALRPRIVCPAHGPVLTDVAGKFPSLGLD